jgi:hypothetical protein
MTDPIPTPAATSDDEFDQLISDASLPETVVPLCVHGTLRREYEQTKERVEERAAQRDAERTAAAARALTDDRLATKAPDDAPVVDPEQGRLDELIELMRAKAINVLVRALPSRTYSNLVAAHPPRRDPNTGRGDPRDYTGANAGLFNTTTFWPALVRASIARPTMTDARWAALEAMLTDAQFDKLAHAAARVNRRDDDVPF